MFYVWLCNSWPRIVINFSTIHFSPVWIQIPFTFGSRQRRTSRCACACLRVSSKRRCSSGWWQTTSALESRVSLLYWKASCMHPLTLRPAPGSSRMTKGLYPGKVQSFFHFSILQKCSWGWTVCMVSNSEMKWILFWHCAKHWGWISPEKKWLSALKGLIYWRFLVLYTTESHGVWLEYCVISLWIATLWHVPVTLVAVSLLDLLRDICSWKWTRPRAIQETFHIKSTPVEKFTLPIDWDKLLQLGCGSEAVRQTSDNWEGEGRASLRLFSIEEDYCWPWLGI